MSGEKMVLYCEGNGKVYARERDLIGRIGYKRGPLDDVCGFVSGALERGLGIDPVTTTMMTRGIKVYALSPDDVRMVWRMEKIHRENAVFFMDLSPKRFYPADWPGTHD